MHERVDALIDRCLQGDQAAWAALVDLHAGLVYAVARRCGLKEDQCDDVAQSVFSTLVRRLSSISDRAALPGWLATAARREAWRVKRRADRAASADPCGPEPAAVGDDPLAGLSDLEDAQRVRTALSELGQRCRDLLMAVVSAAKPDYAAISQRLGIPMGSIGPTRARCLAKLAELLGLGG